MRQYAPCKYIREKLTPRYIAQMRSEIDLHVSDAEVAGFHIRYSCKTQNKVFYLWYRHPATRIQRNLKLGRYPEISLSKAKAAAILYRGQIFGHGIDPKLVLQEESEKQREAVAKKIPLKEIMERYLEEYSKHNVKPKTYLAEVGLCKNYIFPEFGNVPITELNIRHIDKLHNKVGDSKSKSQANRCTMLMSHFLNWCEKLEYRELNTNPCRHIKKFKIQGRDKVMSDENYAKLFEALEFGKKVGIQDPVGFDVIKFIALTGCRRGEAQNLTWDEVDLDNRLLRLKDSKTGARSIPLGTPAVEILREALARKRNEFVFPSRRHNKPFFDIKKHWYWLQNEVGIKDFHVHDLRHSFATVGSMIGENMAVVGSVLGHSQISTTQRYTHINNIKGIEAADNIANRILAKAAKSRK